MRTSVDAAGRVVFPREMRQRLGIRRGRPLEIRERDGRIEVEPTPTSMTLVRRSGGVVAVPGEAPAHGRDRARHARAHPAMIAVDTSVVVAAFASWHQGHTSATAALARRPRVPAHVLLETYSVLTRLPPPHRAPAGLVAAFLAERFTAPPRRAPGSGARASRGTRPRRASSEGASTTRSSERRSVTRAPGCSAGTDAPPRPTNEWASSTSSSADADGRVPA